MPNMEGFTVPFKLIVDAAGSIDKVINELLGQLRQLQNNVNIKIDADLGIDTARFIKDLNKVKLDVSRFKIDIPVYANTKALELVKKTVKVDVEAVKESLTSLVDSYTKRFEQLVNTTKAISKLKLTSPSQQKEFEALFQEGVRQLNMMKTAIENVYAHLQHLSVRLASAASAGNKQLITEIAGQYSQLSKISAEVTKRIEERFSKSFDSLLKQATAFANEINTISGSLVIPTFLTGEGIHRGGYFKELIAEAEKFKRVLMSVTMDEKQVGELLQGFDYSGISAMRAEVSRLQGEMSFLIDTIQKVKGEGGEEGAKKEIDISPYLKKFKEIRSQLLRVSEEYKAFVSQQLESNLQLKTGEEGWRKSLNVISSIVDMAAKYKSQILTLTEYLKEGYNILKVQDSFYSALLSLARSGQEVEAKKVADLVKESKFLEQAEQYLSNLVRYEREYSEALGSSLVGVRGRKVFLEEQLRVLKSMFVLTEGTNAANIFDQLVQTQEKLAETTALEKFKNDLASIGTTISSSPLAATKRLIKAVNEYSLATGKSAAESETTLSAITTLINQLVTNYKKLDNLKLPTETVISFKKQIVDSLDIITQLGVVSESTAKEIRKAFGSEQIKLESLSFQLSAQKDIARNLEKVLALQVAGVDVVKNLEEMERQYIRAKRDGVDIENFLLKAVENRYAVTNNLVEVYRRFVELGKDVNLMPKQQLAQLESAKKTLELIVGLSKKLSEEERLKLGVDTESIKTYKTELMSLIAERTKEVEQIKVSEEFESKAIELIRRRSRLEAEVRQSLAEGTKLISEATNQYREYLSVVDKVILAIQKGVIGVEEDLSLSEVKKNVVSSIAKEYQTLVSLSQKYEAGSIEHIRILEQQKNLLKGMLDLVGTGKFEFPVGGFENVEAIKKAYQSVVETIQRLTIPTKESMFAIDTSKLVALEEKVKVIKRNLEATEFKISIDTSDFIKTIDSTEQVKTSLRSYASALRSLYTEQLRNKAATDEQRISTLKTLTSVEQELNITTEFERRLKSLNDYLASKSTTLEQFFSSPETVLQRLTTTELNTLQRRLTDVGVVLQKVFTVTPTTNPFKALADSAKVLEDRIKGVREVMAGLKEVSFADILKEREATLTAQIKERIADLQQGGNVIEKWRRLIESVNTALKEGVSINDEMLSVLFKEETIYRKIYEYAQQLVNYATANIDKLPKNIQQTLATQANEAKKILEQYSGVGNFEGYSEFTKSLTSLNKQVGVGEFENITKAMNQLEEVRRVISEMGEAFIGPTRKIKSDYEAVGGFVDATVKEIKKWRDLNDQILKDANFIKNVDEETYNIKRKDVQELNNMVRLLQRAQELNARLQSYSVKTGVSLEEMKTPEGLLKLNEATKSTPKLYLDILKANDEYAKLLKQISDTIPKSKELQEIFGAYASAFDKAAREADEVNTKLKTLETLKEKQVRREAGASILDIFRLNWFIQLRLFWQAYLFLGRLNEEAIEFLHNMKLLGAITQASSQDIETLTNAFDELGKTVAYSMSELAKAGTEIAKAGYSIQDTIKILETGSKLAYTTGASIEDSANVITTVLRAWSMDAGRAEEVSNILFNTIVNSKASLDGLKTAIGYVAGIAPQANVTFSEISAMLGILTNAGLQASKAGTYTRQFINALLNPSAKLIDSLHKVGLSLSDVDIKSGGIIKVLQRMHDAGFNVADAFDSMNVRAASAFSVLIRNTDILEEFTNTLESQQVLLDAFGESADSLKAHLTLMVNSLVTEFAKNMDSLSPVIEGVLAGAEDMITGVLRLVELFIGWMDNLGYTGKQTAVKFSEITTVMLALVSAMGLLSKIMPKLIGLFELFAGALNPWVFVALTTAFGSFLALARASISDIDEVTGKLSDLRDSLKELQSIAKEGINIRVKLERGIEIANLGNVFRDKLQEFYKVASSGNQKLIQKMFSRGDVKVVVRAFMESVTSALMNYPDKDIQEIGKRLRDQIFTMEAGPEEVARTVEQFYTTLTKLNGAFLKNADILKGKWTSALEKGTTVLEKLDDTMHQLIDSFKVLKEKKADLESLDWEASPQTIDTVTKAFTESRKQYLENLKKTFAIIQASFSAIPKTKEGIPQLEILQGQLERLKIIISEVTSLKGENAIFSKDEVAKLKEMTNAIDEFENKINVTKATIQKTVDETITDISSKVTQKTKESIQQADMAILKEVDKLLKDLKSLTSKVTVGVKLTLLSPQKGNIANLKKDLSDVYEKTQTILASITHLSRGVFSLSSSQAKELVQSLEQIWTAISTDLKRTAKDGVVTFDEITKAAERLRSSTSLRQFSLEGLMRVLGVGREAVQALENEVNAGLLDTFSNLEFKINEVGKALEYIQKHRKAFDAKDVKQVVNLLDNLLNKQVQFLQTITQASTSIFQSANYAMSISSSIREAFTGTASLDDLLGVSDTIKSLEKLKGNVTDVIIEFDALHSKFGDLSALLGKNAENSMIAQQAFAKLGRTASQRLDGLVDSLRSSATEIKNITNEIKNLNVEIAKIKFDWLKTLEEFKVKYKGPEYEFKAQQENLINQGKYVQEVLQNNPSIDTVVSALTEFRNSLIEFAKANAYQRVGKESFTRAEEITKAIIQLREKQKALLEARLQIQLNYYAMVSKFALSVIDLLGRIKGILGELYKVTAGQKAAGEAATKGQEGVKAPKAPTGVKPEAGKLQPPTKATKPTTPPAPTTTTPEIAKTPNINTQSLQEYAQKLMESSQRLKQSSADLNSFINSLSKLGGALKRQKVNVLSAKEALMNYSASLGTINSIIQQTFNSMADTIRGTLANVMTSALKQAFEGDVDWYGLFSAFYYQIMQMYFDMLLKIMMQAMIQKLGGKELMDTLFGTSNASAFQSAVASSATSFSSAVNNASTEIITAGQTFHYYVANAALAIQNAAASLAAASASSAASTAFNPVSLMGPMMSLLSGAAGAGAPGGGGAKPPSGPYNNLQLPKPQFPSYKVFKGGLIPGYYTGGVVLDSFDDSELPAFASGGFAGLVRKGQTDKDSVVAKLAKNEFVVNNRIVSELGVDFFEKINQGDFVSAQSLLNKKIIHTPTANPVNTGREVMKFANTFSSIKTQEVRPINVGLEIPEAGKFSRREPSKETTKEQPSKTFPSPETEAPRVEVVNIAEPAIARRYINSTEGKERIVNIITGQPLFKRYFSKF